MIKPFLRNLDKTVTIPNSKFEIGQFVRSQQPPFVQFRIDEKAFDYSLGVWEYYGYAIVHGWGKGMAYEHDLEPM